MRKDGLGSIISRHLGLFGGQILVLYVWWCLGHGPGDQIRQILLTCYLCCLLQVLLIITAYVFAEDLNLPVLLVRVRTVMQHHQVAEHKPGL